MNKVTLNQFQIKEDIEKEINNNTISFFAIKGRAGCVVKHYLHMI